MFFYEYNQVLLWQVSSKTTSLKVNGLVHNGNNFFYVGLGGGCKFVIAPPLATGLIVSVSVKLFNPKCQILFYQKLYDSKFETTFIK